MRTKLLVIALCAVALVAGWFLISQLPQVKSRWGGTSPTAINTFDDCRKAGYPVMESFPEQCRTPEGRVFIADLKQGEQGCQDDLSCGLGKWCDQGVCKKVEYSYACTQDSDCQLVNSTYGYGCCYAGQCDPIDYSQSNWIAVNATDYTNTAKRICPSTEQCGPMPGCPSSFVPSDFVARCQQGQCVKGEKASSVPKTPTPPPVCKDLCGDKRCQSEINCLGSSCACPETIESCPRDCDPKNWPD